MWGRKGLFFICFILVFCWFCCCFNSLLLFYGVFMWGGGVYLVFGGVFLSIIHVVLKALNLNIYFRGFIGL